jgi:hypothetical protein
MSDSLDLAEAMGGLNGSALQELFDSASDTALSKKIEKEGQFVAVVETKAFWMKDKDTGHDKLIKYPSFRKTQKGGLQLLISLKTIEEVDGVPAGSVASTSINILPPSDSEAEKVKKMFGITKRHLGALLGHKNILINDIAWLTDNLVAEFKEGAPGDFEVIRGHKMTQKVLITMGTELHHANKNKVVVVLAGIEKYDMQKQWAKAVQVETSSSQSAGTPPVTSPAGAAAPSGAAVQQSLDLDKASKPAIDDDLPF